MEAPCPRGASGMRTSRLQGQGLDLYYLLPQAIIPALYLLLIIRGNQRATQKREEAG